MTDLPSLVSQWDQAIMQLDKLRVDVSRGRADCLLTVAVVDGVPDVRGMGFIDTPEKALALAVMAMNFLAGQANRAATPAAGSEVMEHSKAVAAEAPIWNQMLKA